MPPAKRTTGSSGTGRAKARTPRDQGTRERPPRPETPPVSPFQPGFAPECLACPFGLFFFAMKNTKPEAMDHLMRAGFELFQAFKAVMDTYAERWDQAQQLQRIPIA